MQLGSVTYRMQFYNQTNAVNFIEKKVNQNKNKKRYHSITFECEILDMTIVYKTKFIAAESLKIRSGILRHVNCPLEKLNEFKQRLEKKQLIAKINPIRVVNKKRDTITISIEIPGDLNTSACPRHHSSCKYLTHAHSQLQAKKNNS